MEYWSDGVVEDGMVEKWSIGVMLKVIGSVILLMSIQRIFLMFVQMCL